MMKVAEVQEIVKVTDPEPNSLSVWHSKPIAPPLDPEVITEL
jgi:hypothetical protein